MLDTVQNGYPGLARLIGPNIDQGLGIFREFAELNAKNLLYMQAEIICLQKELDVETYKDEYGPDAIANSFSRSVQDMRQSTTSKDRGQWKKVLEIRDRLSAYNACLIQQAQIAKIDRVNEHDLSFLKGWIRHPEGGRDFLKGIEYKAYSTRERADLLSISSRAANDGFSRWLETQVVPRLPERILRYWIEPIRGSERVVGYSRVNLKVLETVARCCQVVLAAAIPAIAVLVLHFIGSQTRRLGAIAAFSCLFSLTLAIFTTARPVEIFTATAAFASVQVVFVGTADVGGSVCAQELCRNTATIHH